MKKNVIIGVLLILFFFLVLYAKIQVDFAEEMAVKAEEMQQQAMQQAVFARQAEAEAIVQKQEAEKQLRLAQEELEKCKNN